MSKFPTFPHFCKRGRGATHNFGNQEIHNFWFSYFPHFLHGVIQKMPVHHPYCQQVGDTGNQFNRQAADEKSLAFWCKRETMDDVFVSPFPHCNSEESNSVVRRIHIGALVYRISLRKMLCFAETEICLVTYLKWENGLESSAPVPRKALGEAFWFWFAAAGCATWAARAPAVPSAS